MCIVNVVAAECVKQVGIRAKRKIKLAVTATFHRQTGSLATGDGNTTVRRSIGA